MDNLIYVTKIVDNKTGEEIFVFVDKNNYQKYFSKQKDRFVPCVNTEFLEKLNSNKELNSEAIDNLKKRIISIVAASTGISIAVLSGFYLRDQYSIVKKNEFLSAITIDFDSEDSVSSELSRIVDLNDNFTDKEKELLKAGTANFFKDWGYLFSEEDFYNLLYRIGNLKIKGKDDLGYAVAGSYWNLKAELLNRDDYFTLIHEAIHCMMDHNGVNGFRDQNGLGRAIDEAITEAINQYYFYPLVGEKDHGQYINERRRLFNISFLIEPEELIKRCFTDNTPIVEIFKKNCPGVDEEKIVKYITMIDMDCSGLFDETYTPDLNFYSDIDSLFNELYKSKHGIEYNSFFQVLTNNFLSKDVTFIGGNFIYTVPKNMYLSVKHEELSNSNKYEEYITGLYFRPSESHRKMPLILFGCDDDERTYIDNNIDAFLLDLYRKYENDEEKQREIIDILNLTENSFKSYIDIYIDLLKERNLHPAVFAAELRKGLDLFKMSCSYVSSEVDRELFYSDEEYKKQVYKLYGCFPTKEMIEERSAQIFSNYLSTKVDLLGNPDLSYWYNNTNISFINYDLYNMESCRLCKFITETKKVDEFLTLDDGKYIVPIEDGFIINPKDFFSYTLVQDEKVIDKCSSLFKNKYSQYILVTMKDDSFNYNRKKDAEDLFISFEQRRFISVPDNLTEPYKNVNMKGK